MKIIVIDNYDSFVYNICDYIGRIGSMDIVVIRNDAVGVREVLEMRPAGIVVSPGPGTPQESGMSVELIKKLPADIPLLGVCLGHQALAYAFGAEIVRADRIFHGKVSPVHHDGSGVFAGMDNPFSATRYHSLLIRPDTLPDIFAVTATTDRKDEIMGIKHKSRPMFGVQFHPESILTHDGIRLLENFTSMLEVR